MRLVITSSFAAIVSLQGAVSVYISRPWNPITMEQALTNGQLAYVGTKKFAEKPVWETGISSKTKSPISPLPLSTRHGVCPLGRPSRVFGKYQHLERHF